MNLTAKSFEELYAVCKGWEWRGPFKIEYINIERRNYETVIMMVRGGKSCWVRLDQCVTGDLEEMQWHCERATLAKMVNALNYQQLVVVDNK